MSSAARSPDHWIGWMLDVGGPCMLHPSLEVALLSCCVASVAGWVGGRQLHQSESKL